MYTVVDSKGAIISVRETEPDAHKDARMAVSLMTLIAGGHFERAVNGSRWVIYGGRAAQETVTVRRTRLGDRLRMAWQRLWW